MLDALQAQRAQQAQDQQMAYQQMLMEQQRAAAKLQRDQLTAQSYAKFPNLLQL